ncbi:DUF6456 domain-containing protein [Bradyrhizobium sp. HKCCYLS20291]|uniref:DUF6456 domain-containing protein n=1 Tax=Bradyrhizobium sp. HKCCYLS20291 TaxID=3420766 RepID=UPI003EBBFE9D
MARPKRSKSIRISKSHDRRAHDLPPHADVVAVEIDDPLALEPGEKIVALRSVRNDPLGRLHAHKQLDDAQYRAGRAFQSDWERAERGPQAIDPSRDHVDGAQGRELLTEGQRQAMVRLNRAERELGADGAAIVHDILVHGLTMELVGHKRGLASQRWNDYFARRFKECLDRLAVVYGFSNGRPAGSYREATRPTRRIDPWP